LARLRRYCPEAVPAATVAGDPCLDRLRASLHLRDSYRHAFGLSPTRRLVVLSSTWGAHSLHGRHPELALRFARDLPIDRYQVAVALHPNVWHAHSPWQIKSWLAASRRAGVLVLSPWEQWRAALVAADVVVGDFGSVPMYAAAIGRPVLVAATHPDGLDPASPVARFGAAAPALDLGEALDAQLEAVIAEPGQVAYASILNEATAAPGRSAALLRATFYRWMDLPEPDRPAVTPPVAIPVGNEAKAATPTAIAVGTRLSGDGGTLRMTRFPAALRLSDPPPGDNHLLVEWRHHDPSLTALADVLICRPEDTFETPEAWIHRTLHDFPGCVVAAVGGGPECVVGARGAATIRLAGDVSAAVLASAVHGWLTAGRPLDEIDKAALLLDGNVLVRLRARPAATPPTVPRPSPPAEQTSSSTPPATP